MRPLTHTQNGVEYHDACCLRQYEDSEAADEAAEQRGADIFLERLIKDVKLATPSGEMPEDMRLRHFLASLMAVLCVRGDRALARAIADATGLSRFYIGREPS
ncbi:hypothetical protein ACVCIH_17835 [Burkholderia glumae]|uniref:hypothetical protein n=1 Tax=Burkholderia glumae TaxID=337 RepID=UPI0020368CE2|nr:hypothetical protein [Burkholderia glumae]MCM2493276.1 hypothetical protein [Burkholderia glumae]